MFWGRRFHALALAAALAALALAVAGCGSSGGSNSDRAALASKVGAEVGSSQNVPGLAGCIKKESLGLPIAQLRGLANANSNSPASVKATAYRLLANCIRQGVGVSALHELIAQSVLQNAPPTLPKAYTNCVITGANATTATQLASLIDAIAAGGLNAAHTQAEQLGVRLGVQCFKQPGVLSAIRAAFTASLEQGFKSAHYSAAFKNCVLGKARKISANELEQFAVHPATANSLGYQFGRNAAKACVASGAKP